MQATTIVSPPRRASPRSRGAPVRRPAVGDDARAADPTPRRRRSRRERCSAPCTTTPTRSAWPAYLASINDAGALVTTGTVHPGWLLLDANEALSANVVLGPWIHVGSELRLHRRVAFDEEVETRAVVSAEYERKGHRFVELDVVTLASGEPAMSVHHTAIYRPRRGEAGALIRSDRGLEQGIGAQLDEHAVGVVDVDRVSDALRTEAVALIDDRQARDRPWRRRGRRRSPRSRCGRGGLASPSWPGIRSMIVVGSTRSDGNGASPLRHSSTRTPSSPKCCWYQASDRSTSATTSTRWSSARA